jgi:hypothetical protein
METLILFLGNTMVLQVDELQDVDGNFVNNATVTATLLDSTGAQVSGQSWPLTLAYVAASNGRYTGNLAYGLVLTRAAYYELDITVTTASYYAAWRKTVQADARVE